MNWALILPGLAALLAKLTGLQQFERDSPPKMTDPKLKAKLDYAVISCVAVGLDERRYVETSPGMMALSMYGQRQFALQVRCISYDHGPTMSAEYYIERIRSKLAWPSSQAAINALGCSWLPGGSFRNLSDTPVGEKRVFSIGAGDFSFLATIADSEAPDSADSPVPTIDHVIMTSVYLFGESGAPQAPQIGPDTVPPLP